MADLLVGMQCVALLNKTVQVNSVLFSFIEKTGERRFYHGQLI